MIPDDEAKSLELRWFIGHVIGRLEASQSLSEAFEQIGALRLPIEWPSPQALDTPAGIEDLLIHCGMLLYGDQNDVYTRVLVRCRSAFDRLAAPYAPTESSTAQPMASDAAAVPAQESGESAVVTNAQIVEVEGDVTGNIVNAPMGVVIIGDRYVSIDELLGGDAGMLISESLRIRLLACDHRTESAIRSLFLEWRDYQESPSNGTLGERVLTRANSLAKSVLGLEITDRSLGRTNFRLPLTDPGSTMIFVPGGRDPLTGAEVQPFYMAKYPVTGIEYHQFISRFGYPVPPRYWNGFTPPDWSLDAPIVDVSAADAYAYCHWLRGSTYFRFRLPTEAEWNFAATGGRTSAYPWGEDFDPTAAVTLESQPGGPQSVYGRTLGDSPFGISDMCGNAWELVSTMYPDDTHSDDTPLWRNVIPPPILRLLYQDEWWRHDVRIPSGVGDFREAVRLVMKGGSWGGDSSWSTLDRRIWTSFMNRGMYGTFRVVCSAMQDPAGGWVPAPSLLAPMAFNLQRYKVGDSEPHVEDLPTIICGGYVADPGGSTTDLNTSLLASLSAMYGVLGRGGGYAGWGTGFPSLETHYRAADDPDK